MNQGSNMKDINELRQRCHQLEQRVKGLEQWAGGQERWRMDAMVVLKHIQRMLDNSGFLAYSTLDDDKVHGYPDEIKGLVKKDETTD